MISDGVNKMHYNDTNTTLQKLLIYPKVIVISVVYLLSQHFALNGCEECVRCAG